MPEQQPSGQVQPLDPAAVMLRLRGLAENTGTGDDSAFRTLKPDDLEIWRVRRISSHRPILGTIYAGIRKWVYREIRLSVEKALRTQGRINTEFTRLLQRLDKRSGDSE